MTQRPIRRAAPPFGQRLVIIKDGLQAALPYQYSLDGVGDIKYRVKEEAKAYNHGATLTGDGKVDSRKIKIGIDVFGLTEEKHDRLANELLALFQLEDYRLISGRADRRYHVKKLAEVKHDFRKGFKQRWSSFTFTLVIDPFRYAAQETTKNTTFATAPEAAVIQITNSGSAPDTPLKIQLVPAATMSDVNILHVESGRACRIRDSLLTSPAVLTVDTKAGTVRRDNNNAINAFSGQFLTALPGVNNYQITSAAGQVNISYTERWLV